jgi:PAS domain S-box/diguanylate cyclase (GGDEF) domain
MLGILKNNKELENSKNKEKYPGPSAFNAGCSVNPKIEALKIASIYVSISVIWILFSDIITQYLRHDMESVMQLSIIKGLAFVFITTFILYIKMKQSLISIRTSEEKLLSSYMELEAAHEELTALEEELKQQFDELQESQRILEETEERYRLAVEGANDGIWDWDILNGGMFFFQRTKEILGFGNDEMGNSFEMWKSLIHPDDADMVMNELNKHLENMTPYYKCEYRVKAKDGRYKWILSRGKAVWDAAGRPVRMAGSHTDITERREADNRIYNLAYYDTLTGLPNRAMFNEKLKDSLLKARNSNLKLSVLYLDLDNFKIINDTYGHETGNNLLSGVGGFLKDCLMDGDIVARLGGDEFAILLWNIKKINTIADILSTINHRFSKPWLISGHEFYTTVSTGVTIFPDDGLDIETLIKNADTAMYRAKELGKNGFAFFTKSMNERIAKRLEMENRLRQALEKNEFVMQYQPQIDLNSGEISGVEALIRWNDPLKGMVSPMEFIPAAEDSGLINTIGEWVLRTVCRQNKIWQDKGYKPVNVSVNISCRQFQQQNLIKMIAGAIEDTGMDIRYLELEITETAAMKDLEYAIVTLLELKKMGIKVSLDDFGIGYSSLNYLRQLPIDTVKIDHSFIMDILAEGSTSRSIVEAIISLSHSMGLKIVAEGVETDEQLEFLKKHNCDCVQGYLLSKPLFCHDIEKVLPLLK